MTNDIIFTDGTESKGHLGGAGLFALTGVKCWEDDVLFLTPAGPDFLGTYGGFMADNQLSLCGVRYTLPHTLYEVLRYFPDGTWVLRSIYGEHYREAQRENLALRAEMVLPFCGPETRGIYLCSAPDDAIWDELGRIREAAPNAKIMWELPQRVERPELVERIFQNIEKVDYYSLNLPESKLYFGTGSEEQSLAAIIRHPKPCFFRVGERGAYWAEGGAAAFAPSVEADSAVDPTGCGNCSTAAAMVGAAEGLPPQMIAIKANIAAGLTARQYGPFPKMTAGLRRELEAKARRLMREAFSQTRT